MSRVIQIPALGNIFSESLWYRKINAWSSYLLFIKKELIKCYPGGSVKKKTSWNPNTIARKLQNINIKRNAGNRNDPSSDIKHNECCDKILNNFRMKVSGLNVLWLTSCLIFQNTFLIQDIKWNFSSFKMSIYLHHLKTDRICFLIICKIFTYVSIFKSRY